MDIDTREKSFYEALGVVPEVPAGILERVERNVRRSGVKRRAVLAACLLLAFIIPASLVVITANDKAAAAYADDLGSMDELLYAFEFLNGDADDAYTLLDDEIQLEDSAAGAARQQQPSGSGGEQLTKKLSEKGQSNGK